MNSHYFELVYMQARTYNLHVSYCQLQYRLHSHTHKLASRRRSVLCALCSVSSRFVSNSTTKSSLRQGAAQASEQGLTTTTCTARPLGTTGTTRDLPTNRKIRSMRVRPLPMSTESLPEQGEHQRGASTPWKHSSVRMKLQMSSPCCTTEEPGYIRSEPLRSHDYGLIRICSKTRLPM